jgi:hypothetical protein
MTNKEFYAFCKLRKNNQCDGAKEIAISEVWRFMWECGVTKQGVKQFIDHQITQCQGNQKRIDAYRWLQGVFDGSVSVNEQPQSSLFDLQ